MGWGGGGEICLWWRQTTQSQACFSSLFKEAQSWLTPLVVIEFEQVVICHFLKQRHKKKNLWEVRAASQQTSGRMAVLSSKCVDGVVSFPFPVCICDVKRTTTTDGIKRQCEICIWLNSHIKPLTLLFMVCVFAPSVYSPSLIFQNSFMVISVQDSSNILKEATILNLSFVFLLLKDHPHPFLFSYERKQPLRLMNNGEIFSSSRGRHRECECLCVREGK